MRSDHISRKIQNPLQFFERAVTVESYKEFLETKFFFYAKKQRLIKKFHFTQDSVISHRICNVFELILKVYDNKVIGLGCLKFAHGSLERPLHSPILNLCNFFL